jgi:PPOX class probable F420-dependent enzyme
MSATIPESHRDLLTGPVFAVLTTLMPDSQPQSSVVWTDFDGENVLVNTVLGRQKARNMAERPKVSLLAIDTNHPFRWLEVRGEVEEMTEDGAADHIAALARLYTGSPAYYGYVAPAEQAEKETRVICKIEPIRVVTSGT